MEISKNTNFNFNFKLELENLEKFIDKENNN